MHKQTCSFLRLGNIHYLTSLLNLHFIRVLSKCIIVYAFKYILKVSFKISHDFEAPGHGLAITPAKSTQG